MDFVFKGLPDPSDPETSSTPPVGTWKDLLHHRLVTQPKIRVRQENLECAVEGKKSLEQILLGPKPQLIRDPLPRRLSRQKDVVEVDDHTWFQLREYFEQQVTYIPPDSDDMRRVDEQEVTAV